MKTRARQRDRIKALILSTACIGMAFLSASCGGGGSTAIVPVSAAAGSNPQPSLTSLSPSSAYPGAAAQTLTLIGTNFLSTSTVTYNGAGHAATFVSSTQLTIGLTAADEATAGSYAVVVTNP
ncbi:MAG: IPT/TIG domain-containing protein, partial [Terriglobia bacterium]